MYEDILDGFEDIIGSKAPQDPVNTTSAVITDEWENDDCWSLDSDSYWKNSVDEWRS